MNILIVEDEAKTARLLQEWIEEHEECLVVNTCQSISAAVAYLSKHQAKLDLIFMDIQLADGESMEIFQQIKVVKPVVFCTAYNDYMLEAFRNNGVDYILKPFRQEDIDASLQKIYLLKRALHQANSLEPAATFQRSFLVQQREKMIPLPVEDIALAFLQNESVHILKFNGEQAAIFKTLDEIERALDPAQFFRINRQMLVSRRAVRSIEPYFNRKLSLHLHVKAPEALIVSRLKVSPFKDWLEGKS